MTFQYLTLKNLDLYLGSVPEHLGSTWGQVNFTNGLKGGVGKYLGSTLLFSGQVSQNRISGSDVK